MDTEKSSDESPAARRTILITGAEGLLGRQVVQWLSARHQVVAASRREVNITDADAVNRYIDGCRPDLIINCAALSNVDACEGDPDAAYAANAHGPRHLARAARRIGAELVHISTDYVFDGQKRTPYTIEDEPRPINVYGESKLAGERFVREACEQHYVIRVARLFGPGGRNFASTALQRAKQHGQLVAIVDEIGSPTYVVDLAQRLEMIVRRGHYGTYHVTNQGACSWADFAAHVIACGRLSGVTIQQVRSADLHRPARRPAYTEMRCLLSERLGFEPLRPWQQAYSEFIKSQTCPTENSTPTWHMA